MRRAVFFDRDGTLNETVDRDGSPGSPRAMDELEIVSDAPEGLQRLHDAGFVLLCATNQPEVARGLTSRTFVDSVNRCLLEALPLDEVLVCWHDDGASCACRKPLPGLLNDAAQRLDLDLQASFMVGDRWRDVEAGRAAGCHSILVLRPWSEQWRCSPEFTAGSLTEACAWILDRGTG